MKTQNAELATAEDNAMYDRSFTARIAQADDTVRGYYNEVKAELLSYKGVKSRVSWAADSYNKGRAKYAKLQIKGKTLVLYLALDPEEVAPKYHAQNVSDVAKYAAVPTKLRLRNPRALKYAKELIAQLMEKSGVAKTAHAPAIEDIPAQTTEELLRAGFIKCKDAALPAFWGKTND